MRRRFLFFCSLLLLALPASPASIAVLRFQNNSQYSDLNWVGESIATTLMNEFAAHNEIVLSRGARTEAMNRLSLRPDGNFTKATLIRLGQTLDAEYLCFGSFDVTLPSSQAPLKDSSIRIATQFVDLRKMHDGPEMSEAGRLTELSRLQEHLAYESLKYLQPKADLKADDFMSPQKAVRLDAQESYVRGLLSENREQKQKWFLQAVALDGKFADPAYELGRICLEQRQYPQAIDWFRRIAPAQPAYPEARFRMGLAAYGSADYAAAASYFRETLKTYPLSEVYNNLGAAETQLNQPAAIDDLRHALETDPNNPAYLFNFGVALLKINSFDDAAQRFRQALDHSPSDAEARTLLDQAMRRQPVLAAMKLPPLRLKTSFSATAFRQLKAMLQPSGSSQ